MTTARTPPPGQTKLTMDQPENKIESKDKVDKKVKDDKKLSTILVVLTQMKYEMKINNDQLNTKIDKQNAQIKKNS